VTRFSLKGMLKDPFEVKKLNSISVPFLAHNFQLKPRHVIMLERGVSEKNVTEV